MTARQILLISVVCLSLAFLIPSDGGLNPFEPTTGEVSVLIVEETAERPLLPESQLQILNSTMLREWAKTHCDKNADGHPEFRVIDRDADTSNMTQKWRDRIAEAKSKPLPYVAISTGRSGAAGDLPLTEAELMPFLEKYAGK